MGDHGFGRPIAAAMLTAAVLVGCGGSAGPGAAQRTALERTLAGIRDDPSVRLQFEFGDIAAERTLAGVPPTYGAGHSTERWNRILGFGADYFGQEDPSGSRDGLDILTGSIGVVIGQPPHLGGMITGPLVDGAKVRAAVEKLGAVPATVDGRPGVTWGREGSEHLNAVNSFGAGPGLGEFDRAIITAHAVIAGRYTSEVSTLTGGGSRSAAADPTLAATSACLGDVVAAFGQAITAHGAPVEIAVGVRRPMDPTTPVQELMCVVAASHATHLTGATLCSRIGPTSPALPGTPEPPSRLDTAAKPVSGEIDGARWAGCIVTDRAAIPAGWLLSVMSNTRDPGSLIGP